jgi:DNA-directed RNA polymerase subunit M/transcription elongation factor TFIIS
MKRLCLDCDSPLIGRSDKKFCDDACRSNFNNKSKSNDEIYIRKVNVVLNKNRRILKQFNPEGKVRMKVKKLQTEGFDFDCFTSIYRTAKGNKYYFCYEYGYLLLPPDEVLLIKRKDFTNQ